MNDIFNTKLVIKTRHQWAEVLDELLKQLSSHLGVALKKCSYFIEDQVEGESSFGCHVDFRGLICKSLHLEFCGILCFDVSWGEEVSIGAYILHYQNGVRLVPNADDESVTYLPREIDSWGSAHIEIGEGDEWSGYDSPMRWDD